MLVFGVRESRMSVVVRSNRVDQESRELRQAGSDHDDVKGLAFVVKPPLLDATQHTQVYTD